MPDSIFSEFVEGIGAFKGDTSIFGSTVYFACVCRFVCADVAKCSSLRIGVDTCCAFGDEFTASGCGCVEVHKVSRSQRRLKLDRNDDVGDGNNLACHVGGSFTHDVDRSGHSLCLVACSFSIHFSLGSESI